LNQLRQLRQLSGAQVVGGLCAQLAGPAGAALPELGRRAMAALPALRAVLRSAGVRAALESVLGFGHLPLLGAAHVHAAPPGSGEGGRPVIPWFWWPVAVDGELPMPAPSVARHQGQLS
jgi:hypothetical protein